MTYATAQEFINSFPDDESIQLTNLDKPGSYADEDRINTALGKGFAEINSYIAVAGYVLPLPTIPAELKNLEIIIARYRLEAYQPREHVRKDYEDAITWLKEIAAGKAVLSIPMEDVISYLPSLKVGLGDRRFTRQNLGLF